MLERIHLRLVKTVEEQGSLTSAAKELCLTQSALSHTIRKLEDKLGTSIWIRDGRKLRLTQSGQYLLNVANRILPQLEYAESKLQQFGLGEQGLLRIGMECHPCYQWLLKIVSPFLKQWPGVDVDVKQRFRFGGVGALFDYEIDLLVTPDPFFKEGLHFEPVFDYEQVLVVNNGHQLSHKQCIQPEDLRGETLITYPVDVDRLDIFTEFLKPSGVIPKRHKTIEATDILLQMVASNRGVTALPKWLACEYQNQLGLSIASLGKQGVFKKIYLGTRESDNDVRYLSNFVELARSFWTDKV
ncbi:LysR substrate-binding domain-containing protein [Sessilibacter sp. MAH1]